MAPQRQRPVRVMMVYNMKCGFDLVSTTRDGTLTYTFLMISLPLFHLASTSSESGVRGVPTAEI
jgi:hypothetical protein